MKTYRSFSSDETKMLGKMFAKKIIDHPSSIFDQKDAIVLALQGDLGAGKTTFTQGFFRGLGIRRRAVSPTFVIMRRYRTHNSRFKNVYHFDAYRLSKAEDLEVLEVDDILSNPKNIVLVEWPERIKRILPKRGIWLKFQYGSKENERTITVSGVS
jgi:tRNA threonylcarbamoyladenosine biosynthesis protein TsaE